MGSLRRKTSTRALPDGAELVTRKGETFARWIDRNGKKRSAPTKIDEDGSTKVVVEYGRWLAKYRDADGVPCEVSTGCSDKQNAAAVLADLIRDADRERAGIISSKENSALVNAGKPISGHLDSYDAARRAEGLAPRTITDTRQMVEKVAGECGFKTLASVRRHKVEGWLDSLAESGTGARRRNLYLEALRAFLSWCVKGNRLMNDPLDGIARADQDADVRRDRRALSDDEFPRLLKATTLRPLAELGRETVMLEPVCGKRSSWTYASLTLANIDAAIERARTKLADKPDLIEAKLWLGRERGLIVTTAAMTGLRRGELAALRLRNLFLDELQPYIKLDRKSEKNRQGNTIPLRMDLANDLRQWISDRSAKAQEAAQNVPTLKFEVEAARMRRGDQKRPDAGRLSGELLFNVPDRFALVKILNKDYAVAGIPKTDDRGRTVDVHCLRHSFATWIGESGVSPKDAQKLMRHSDINQTMRYTHGRPDADQKALAALPALSLTATAIHQATGTDDEYTVGKCPPICPPDSDNESLISHSGASAGNLGGLSDDSASVRKRPENPAKQGISGHPAKYTREDSNLQPPVPKTGAATPATNENGSIAAVAGDVSAYVSASDQKTDVESPGPSFKELDLRAMMSLVSTLPLSDAEKAASIRRLLERDDSQ